MNRHIWFYEATDEIKYNVLPMPKTREQREAEQRDFNGLFFYCCGVVYLLGTLAFIAWMSTRGGR